MAEKVRVGVIGRTGHGDYGHGLDEVWLRLPEVEIVGVADDNDAGLAKAVARLKAPKAYKDYRKLLDETKPHVVAICQRWLDEHHSMVLAALERGIHVFLEKPMCRTLAEADSIVRQCEMTHTHVVLAHQTHYSPRLAMVKRLVDEGKIGTLLEVRGRGKEDHRGGGEDLWVLGSHIMDIMRYIAGEAQWCYANVTNQGKRVVAGDIAPGNEGIGLLTGDRVQAIYGMSSGATAYFATQRKMGGNPSRFAVQFFGSAGVIEIETGYMPNAKILMDASWSPGRSKKEWQNISSAGIGMEEPLKDTSQMMGNEVAVRDLLSAIQENRSPKMNAVQARAAIEMIAGCFESERLGAPVPFPMVQRENPLSLYKA